MIKKILLQKSETETYEDAYIGMGQEIKAMSNSIYRKKTLKFYLYSMIDLVLSLKGHTL